MATNGSSSDDENEHNNINYYNDDDDDDDDDDVNDNRFNGDVNLPIVIVHTLEDCAFVGRMSKHIFRRQQTPNNMSQRFFFGVEYTMAGCAGLTKIIKGAHWVTPRPPHHNF